MIIRCRHRIPSPEAVVPHGGRAQGSRRAISAPAALPEAGMPLAVSDGLREVCRQT